MDMAEKQQRTRRLEDAVSEMEMLMGFYPSREDHGIFLSLRKAKEALFRAVELSKEAEEDEDHEAQPNATDRILDMLESWYGGKK